MDAGEPEPGGPQMQKIGSVGGIGKGREERGGGMSRLSKNGSTIHSLISL